MPQIAQIAETYSSQIFWLLVFFGIVFFVVGRGMVPKVMGTVAQRDGQIASDLAAAEAARAQADEEEEAWRKRENENRAAAQALIARAKADAAASSEKKLGAAQAEGEKLAGLTVQLTEKAGVDGRLFGSVTGLNVVEALRKQGFPSIEKTMVKFPEGPLKTIGDHKIQVTLHTDVTVDITVSVLAETV